MPKNMLSEVEQLRIKIRRRDRFRTFYPLHLMVVPALVFAVVFSYLPMYGIVIAFQRYNITRSIWENQNWVGLANFRFIMNNPDFFRALRNSFIIASLKVTTLIIVPVTFSLLLNEVRSPLFKKSIQTAIYLPHFLSWIVLSSILLTVLSPSRGFVNTFIQWMGFNPIFFLGDAKWFRFTLVITELWKEFGWGTIVYLAAISAVSPELYEAALMDGANKFQQMRYVTLPGISHIVILMTVLALGRILNAGFDQVFNLYSPLVYETGDILETLVYRVGLTQSNFHVSTAIGLFRSVVALVLISISYYAADKLTGYRVF